MTTLYLNKKLYQQKLGLGTHCFNATNTACLVPQAREILDAKMQKTLRMCPTIWDYYCELAILHYAGQLAAEECIKPCHTSQYKLTLDREIPLSRDYGYGETILSLWFSTNTITNYKEVLVVTLIICSA